MTFFERLQNLDRRWLFLAMGIAVVLPLLSPVTMPFNVSPMVQAIHDEVEGLPEGSLVLLSVDYDPAAKPEIEPFTRAVLRHLLRRRARIVFVTLWDKAPPIVRALIDEIVVGEYQAGKGFFAGAGDASYRCGEDYAYLGFKEGKEAVIAGLGQNLRQVYPTVPACEGETNVAIGRVPLLNGVNSLRDFRLIINSSAGFPGAKEYVQQVVARYNQEGEGGRRMRFAASTTAVSVTDLTPYYPNQIFGLAGGMRGSAEYEQLLGYADTGIAGLNVLTFGQLLVIAAIVLGNIIYFVERRRGRKGGR